MAAEEQGAPLESVEQAWQVTRDVRAAAVLVVKNSNLSTEERTRQTQALMQPAEARLTELLGPKAARGVIRDLRVGCNLQSP